MDEVRAPVIISRHFIECVQDLVAARFVLDGTRVLRIYLCVAALDAESLVAW